MNSQRFETLAEAFGGDVAAWPDAEREAAAAFMAADPARAEAILASAAALDEALAAWSPLRAASGVMDAILAKAPKPRTAWRWTGWLVPAGLGAGLAAACAAGVVLGARLSAPPPASDTDSIVTAVSDEDVALYLDEDA